MPESYRRGRRECLENKVGTARAFRGRMRSYLMAVAVVCLVGAGTVGCFGQTREPEGMSVANVGAAVPAGACPSQRPVSQALPLGSDAACKAASMGRWAMCSGKQSYSGSAELGTLWNGAAGLEFAEENGHWVFYYLQTSDTGLVRDTSLPRHGRVEMVTTFDDKCDVILRAEDGQSDAYHRFEFWGNPDAYRDYVYDIYDFVKVP